MKAKSWPRTIRGLTFTFALISFVGTTLLAVAATAIMHRELERQLDARIELETDGLVAFYEDHGFERLVDLVKERERRNGTGNIGYLAEVDGESRSTAYLLIDKLGRQRAGSLSAKLPKLGWSEFLVFRLSNGTRRVAQAMNSKLGDDGYLVVAADREVIRDMHRTMLKLFGLGWGLILLLSVAATFLFGRAVKRRLADIGTSAEAIVAGDMSRRMPLDGSGGEFDRLTVVLNQMLDRISALLDNLRQVSGDIAHDLRTPLQRVRSQLEAIADEAEASSVQPKLDQAVRNMDEVLELFASLLAISEIEGHPARSGFRDVDLAKVVEEIVDVYRATIEDSGRAISYHATSVTVRGDGALLQRVVANLLDNALLHTPIGTHIDLGIEKADGQAILSVWDDGPGIPTEEHDRVFRRLTRLDVSRSTPGHGLGLSLVQAIVHAHDGTVKIVPSSCGLAVAIALPISE